jgi:tellurite resistance protein
MEKPGTRNLLLGAALFAGGSALALVTFWILRWDWGIVLYAVVMAGVALIVVGMVQRVRYERLSPEAKRGREAEASIITLLRCMALVANADGRIDERELRLITAVCRRVLTDAPGAGEIRGILDRIGGGGEDPRAFVASLGRRAPPADRLLIARACQLVMEADGDASAAERRMLALVLDALGVPPSTAAPSATPP